MEMATKVTKMTSNDATNTTSHLVGTLLFRFSSYLYNLLNILSKKFINSWILDINCFPVPADLQSAGLETGICNPFLFVMAFMALDAFHGTKI